VAVKVRSMIDSDTLTITRLHDRSLKVQDPLYYIVFIRLYRRGVINPTI
jgi:hypothetical protein